MIVKMEVTDELTLRCRVPETTRDVLEWTVFVACMPDAAQQREVGFQWLERHVEEPDSFELPLTDGEPSPGSVWLVRICDRLVHIASLDPLILADIERMERRKAGIKEKWNPQSKCDCIQCRWDPADGEVPDLPDGQTCMFGDIDDRAINAFNQAVGIESLDDPWWFTQMSRVLQRVEWLRNRLDAEERETSTTERSEFVQSGQELGAMLRGGRL